MGHFGKTCLLFHKVHFAEVCLGVDEIFYILDKLHVGMIVSEFLNVRAEAKSDDCG